MALLLLHLPGPAIRLKLNRISIRIRRREMPSAAHTKNDRWN